MKGLFLFLFIVLGVLTACSEPPYTNVSNGELQALLQQDYTLVDIRRPEEWLQTGIIEGSKLLTFVDTSGRIKPNFFETLGTNHQPHEPIILICRTGSRTRTLARHLVDKLGYTSVYNVRGGITQWLSDDLPVVMAH